MMGIITDPTICGTPDNHPRHPAYVTDVTSVTSVKHINVSFMVFPHIG